MRHHLENNRTLPCDAGLSAIVANLCLCGSQDVYDRFWMVAVIVLPYVGDSGEGRRGRRGQNGWDGVRLWRLEYFLLHITFCLGTEDRETDRQRKRVSSVHSRKNMLFIEWLLHTERQTFYVL